MTTSWTTRCSAGSARAFRNSDAGVGFVGVPHRHTLLNLADLSVLSCGSTDTNDPTCHDTKATGERGGTDKVGAALLLYAKVKPPMTMPVMHVTRARKRQRSIRR